MPLHKLLSHEMIYKYGQCQEDSAGHKVYELITDILHPEQEILEERQQEQDGDEDGDGDGGNGEDKYGIDIQDHRQDD